MWIPANTATASWAGPPVALKLCLSCATRAAPTSRRSVAQVCTGLSLPFVPDFEATRLVHAIFLDFCTRDQVRETSQRMRGSNHPRASMCSARTLGRTRLTVSQKVGQWKFVAARLPFMLHSLVWSEGDRLALGACSSVVFLVVLRLRCLRR